LSKLLVFIVLLLGSFTEVAADSRVAITDNVVFEGLQQSYPIDGEVQYAVRNRGTETVTFYCTVERKMESGWREMAYSITSGDEKSVRLYALRPRATRTFVWIPVRYASVTKLGAGTYRLKADIQHKDGSTLTQTYAVVSREFELHE
jgi:hypothetical protein